MPEKSWINFTDTEKESYLQSRFKRLFKFMNRSVIQLEAIELISRDLKIYLPKITEKNAELQNKCEILGLSMLKVRDITNAQNESLIETDSIARQQNEEIKSLIKQYHEQEKRISELEQKVQELQNK